MVSRTSIFFMVLLLCLASKGQATDAGSLRPEGPPQGFYQANSQLFLIQTDVSPEFLRELTKRVTTIEQRMLQLFQMPMGFLRGNDPKAQIDKNFRIPGDLLSKSGYKPWIEIRIFKNFEDFAFEYFELSDRLFSIINNTPIKEMTAQQRALRLQTEGVPGAVYWRISDYDRKYNNRLIRGFVAQKNIDEVEASMLHEMGHCFLETFLVEFAGAPKSGQEGQKRGTPSWIAEGVAQLFDHNWASSVESQKNKARHMAIMYEAVVAGHSYPFGDFVNITNAHNLQAVAGDPLKAQINYAQSYSVMQYMVEKDWQRFLQFLSNCRAYHLQDSQKSRKPFTEIYSVQDKAFRDAFGGVSLVQLEQYWSKYVKESYARELQKKPENYYFCGEYWLRRNDLAKAQDRFAKALELAPEKALSQLGMGRIHILKQEFEKAVPYLVKAVQLEPKEEESWYYLGQAQTMSGKHEDAIISLKKATELYSSFHQAFAQLGQACLQARKFKEAQEAFQQAYNLQRSDPRYLLEIGKASFFGQDYNTAMRNFSAFSNILKQEAEGVFWYGMAAWRLGQQDLAKQKFQEALSLRKNHQMSQQALDALDKGQMLRFQNEDQPKVADAGKQDNKAAKEEELDEDEPLRKATPSGG